MTETIENYISPIANKRFAFAAWCSIAFAVCLWFGAIVGAPIFKIYNFDFAADSIYAFFSYLCHQQSDRSFHLHAHQFAVCARCAGVYFGLMFGVLIYPFVRSLDDLQPLPRVLLLLAPLPTTVDFLLGWLGVWENTHLSRFLTAIVLGLGCAFFLVPGIIEISRYFLLNGKKSITN